MNKRKQSVSREQLIFLRYILFKIFELEVLQIHPLFNKGHWSIQLFKLIRSEVYEIQPRSHKRMKFEFEIMQKQE